MEHDAMIRVIDILIDSGMEETEALYLMATVLQEESRAIVDILDDTERELSWN